MPTAIAGDASLRKRKVLLGFNLLATLLYKRRGRMNREAFMGSALALLRSQGGLQDVRREGNNNAQAIFFADVHIGVVATSRAGFGDPGPRVRVHIWSEDLNRRVVWQQCGVEAMPPPYPPGCDLAFRLGPKNPKRFYLEFGWDNDDPDDFTRWLPRIDACVRYFVTARGRGIIP
jgi:hypothetical protein